LDPLPSRASSIGEHGDLEEDEIISSASNGFAGINVDLLC
jgi:hypothetical protein